MKSGADDMSADTIPVRQDLVNEIKLKLRLLPFSLVIVCCRCVLCFHFHHLTPSSKIVNTPVGFQYFHVWALMVVPNLISATMCPIYCLEDINNQFGNAILISA